MKIYEVQVFDDRNTKTPKQRMYFFSGQIAELNRRHLAAIHGRAEMEEITTAEARKRCNEFKFINIK